MMKVDMGRWACLLSCTFDTQEKDRLSVGLSTLGCIHTRELICRAGTELHAAGVWSTSSQQDQGQKKATQHCVSAGRGLNQQEARYFIAN